MPLAPLNNEERNWYYNNIEALDPQGRLVSIDRANGVLTYSSAVRCDESHQRAARDEELVRALALTLLVSKEYNYPVDSLYIEKYYKHGHPSSKRDEVDLIIFDEDMLPFAMWDFKSPSEYDRDSDTYIRYQLFGTAPLVGAPKLLVYATIKVGSKKPVLTLICIDRTQYPSYESWVDDGRPSTAVFPEAYTNPAYEPFVQGGKLDLRFDCTQADFKAAAATFHSEFFGEHPDNVLFTNLVKCLLAKIHDERLTRRGEAYDFQVLYKTSKEETASEVFERVNTLYRTAYTRYIDPGALEPDEIDTREFPAERVKTVVKVLQGMSITHGAALHGDVIGAFFEEILRHGFKQDKGMYFTHANLVYFILEALDLPGLTVELWTRATHPDTRLPYVMDPACGSGSFLLRAMNMITHTIHSRKTELVSDMDSMAFFNARMSDMNPNYWAESFIYGMDPKFVMAITAKVNMVLHGDGSAHIFKYDGLKPFSSYSDSRLRPNNSANRTVPRSRYDVDVAETFDIVVSNPPFGITLAADTRATIPTTFSLKPSASSESFFLERWFQLLKPKGRLGVVVPESLLNTTDSVETRLFLYRMFWLRAIVALPRNLFIQTPTLTSLLFAQKKTAEEIAQWDQAWLEAEQECKSKTETAKAHLLGARRQTDLRSSDIECRFLDDMFPVVTPSTHVIRKGKAPLTGALPARITTVASAINYYSELMRVAGFASLIRNHTFNRVAEKLDYTYPVYLVDEVGYKLSTRNERIRPNQLCCFVGSLSRAEMPNLHKAAASEPIDVVIDIDNPQRILDFIRRDVKWA